MAHSTPSQAIPSGFILSYLGVLLLQTRPLISTRALWVSRILVFPTLLPFSDVYHPYIYTPTLCLMQTFSSHISISISHRVSYLMNVNILQFHKTDELKENTREPSLTAWHLQFLRLNWTLFPLLSNQKLVVSLSSATQTVCVEFSCGTYRSIQYYIRPWSVTRQILKAETGCVQTVELKCSLLQARCFSYQRPT